MPEAPKSKSTMWLDELEQPNEVNTKPSLSFVKDFNKQQTSALNAANQQFATRDNTNVVPLELNPVNPNEIAQQVAEKKKQLAAYYNKPGLVSGVKRTPKQQDAMISQLAQEAVEYENKSMGEKGVGIFMEGLAFAVPEIAIAKYAKYAKNKSVVNPLSGIKGNNRSTKVFKFPNKFKENIYDIKNLPSNIDRTTVSDIIKKEEAWLNSHEYIKRKRAATGLSEDAIKAESKKIIKQLYNTEINFSNKAASDAGAHGVYIQPSGKHNPRIDVYKSDLKTELETLDHEIKHAASETSLDTGDDLLKFLGFGKYNKYPKTKLTKIKDSFLPGETGPKWANNAEEQQVIAKRIMDYAEKNHGISRGEPVTMDVVNDLRKNLNTSNVPTDIKYMFNAFHRKFGKINYPNELLNNVNKAYAVPIVGAVGIEALQQQNETQQHKNGGSVNDSPAIKGWLDSEENNEDGGKIPLGNFQPLDPLNQHGYGRPKNGNSTESIIGINMDDDYFNIPTVIDGIRYSPERSVDMFEQSGNHMGHYSSQEEADRGAQSREKANIGWGTTGLQRYEDGEEVQGEPTKNDSIALSANAIAKSNFYKNNKDYTANPFSEVYDSKKINVMKNLASWQNMLKTVDASKKMFGTETARVSRSYAEDFSTTPKEYELALKRGNLNPTPNIISTPDLLRGDYDNFFNPASPPNYYHPQILPTSGVNYDSNKFKDSSDVYFYDPIAITPWDMQSTKDQQERLKKYGVKGTPYEKKGSDKSSSPKKGFIADIKGNRYPKTSTDFVPPKKATPVLNQDTPPWKLGSNNSGAVRYETDTTNLSGGKGQYVHYSPEGNPRVITQDEYNRQIKIGTPKFQHGGGIPPMLQMGYRAPKKQLGGWLDTL